jgi:hypothetical protein
VHVAGCMCVQEVHDSLASIEAEAERLFATERGLMDTDTQSRDRLYSRAQQVSMGWRGSLEFVTGC